MRKLFALLLFAMGMAVPARVNSQDPPITLTNSLNMEFRLVPRGTFLMGVSRDEYGRLDDDELPQHEVTLTRSFYMGVHEVTQSQYQSLMGANPSHFASPPHSVRRPVENVTWHQAQAFCNALSARTEELAKRRVYRLPTEAEWEYACRAGSDTAYSFGSDLEELGEYAWYLKNSGEKSHPVGGKLPNRFGLYDMHGNVSEWCLDWMGPYDSASAIDPQGPSGGALKVMRGSSFNHWAVHCRSGNRSGHDPAAASWTCGFRVVLEIAP